MNGDGSCGSGRAQIGRTLASALAAGACGEIGDVGEVSAAVSAWVEQVGMFLGVVQAVLEQSMPSADASVEIRAVAGQLPALIRQCRAQVPTPEMIQTWVQTIAQGRGHDGLSALPPPPFMEGRTPSSLRAS